MQVAQRVQNILLTRTLVHNGLGKARFPVAVPRADVLGAVCVARNWEAGARGDGRPDATRRQLVESRPSFGTVALAAHRDAQLQNASSHLKTANVHQAELAELRARRVSTMPVTLLGDKDTPKASGMADLHVTGRISVSDPSRQSLV